MEDLWDDPAATPAEIPVHEWQKETLAHRKTNLMNRPASGLSWDEVKRRVRCSCLKSLRSSGQDQDDIEYLRSIADED